MFAIVMIPPVIVCVRRSVGLGAACDLAVLFGTRSHHYGGALRGYTGLWSGATGTLELPGLLLMPLPFLMWAAVRVGVGGTGLTLLIVAGIALANAYVGRGPFITQAPDVNVLSLQIFLTAISIRSCCSPPS